MVVWSNPVSVSVESESGDNGDGEWPDLSDLPIELLIVVACLGVAGFLIVRSQV